MAAKKQPETGARWARILCWVLAVVLMLAAAVYQRRTGPTHPLRGSYEHAEETYAYRLLRSHVTDAGAPIALPAPESGVTGTLVFQRYPSDDPLTSQAMRLEQNEDAAGWHLVAELPQQPAAGKVAYHVQLESAAGVTRIPAAGEGEVVLRYKGSVPAGVLVPHILFMFLSLLVALRTGLAAAIGRHGLSGLSWTTLGGLTIGGMILGPVVQKHAFGEYWTGFPFGYDLTDNKTLIMWGSWLIACLVWHFTRRGSRVALGRCAILLAAVVTIGVYLIPHSLGGSELDYGLVDAGVSPAEAIETGIR